MRRSPSARQARKQMSRWWPSTRFPKSAIRSTGRSPDLAARLGHKPVSDSPNGKKMARPCRIVLDVSAEPHNEVVDRTRVRVLVQAPHFLEHHPSGNGFAFMLDQVAQEIRFH